MRYLHLTVRQSDVIIKKGLNLNPVPITCGSVNDIACRFEFSSDWADYPVKAASFTGSGKTVTVLLNDSVAIVPWECLTEEGGELLVGITGARDLPDTDTVARINTELFSLGPIVSAADPSADVIHNPPTPDLSQQLLAVTNDVLISESRRQSDFESMLERGNQVISDTGLHLTRSLLTDEGIHGVRLKNGFLQHKNADGGWSVLSMKGSPKIMTAVIDMTERDPTECVTYADDAVGLSPASPLWDTFFGHYPVVLENGVERVRLSRDDFTLDVNGQPVSYGSSADTDVCVAFPRIGIRLYKNGSKIYVSVTNHPSLEGFSYAAHQVGDVDKDVFYLGAYKSSVLNDGTASVLSSLPGNYRCVNSLQTAKTLAQNKNAKLFSYYQKLLIQCMFVLKYKSLNSQQKVGMGMIFDTTKDLTITGNTQKYGMDSQLASHLMTNGYNNVKLFGLEDLWGNVYEWLDGVKTDKNTIYAAKADDVYAPIAQFNGEYNKGYVDGILGTSQGGFIPVTYGGSNDVAFCDWAVVDPDSYCISGGNNTSVNGAGIFALRLGEPADEANQNYEKCARLMFI